MKRFTLLLIVAVLCTGMLLGGCASTKESESMDQSTIVGNEGVAPPEQPAVESMAEADTAAQPAASEGLGIGDLENVVTPETNRKLVYSSEFSIETSSFDQDYKKLVDALASYKGYIESETTSGQQPTTDNPSGRNSYFVFRVPVESYDAFIGNVAGIGTVQSKNMYTEDISSNYYDNDARIAVLEDRKARLMDYLNKTTNMEEVIALEKEISDVMYQLDQLQGTKKQMDSLIDYAKVTVSLYEVTKASNITNADASVSERASNAFSMSMIGIGKFGNEFAVFMAGAFPVIVLLLIILVIVFVIVYVIKKVVRKAKTASENKKLKK